MTPFTLTRRQVRSVDQKAIEQYGMTGLVLMENAGRGCVDVLCRLGMVGRVVICCGKGNNAGDGLVMARHLDNRGHQVQVLLWSPPGELSGDVAANYHILSRTDVPIEILTGEQADEPRLKRALSGAAWIVDSLLGTGAKGAPRPPLDQVIRRLNDCPAAKLAVDLPSGMDCDTGQCHEPTFRADHTCTFVAVKPGLLAEAAKAHVGQVHVVDIGVPRKLIESIVAES